MLVLEQLKPQKLVNVMELVGEAGIDVSDWGNYKGRVPAANPRYCYNWAFNEGGKVAVVCLWHEHIKESQGGVAYDLDLGAIRDPGSGSRVKRAKEMDNILKGVEALNTPLRVIVCGRSDVSKWRVTSRLLDPVKWHIVDHDPTNKRYKLVRGQADAHSHIIDKVLLKEVGKSQHKDGVRIDKAFHEIFNPPNSLFYTKRGTTRKIKVTFNGKEFDAEYRFEGTKSKEVDLQRIGFFRGLRDEFKAVFPVARGTFTIRLGKDVNHFIFDHQQITSEAYDEQLEYEVTKSRKDSKEARQKRLAEAARKPASVQVTSVAYVRNPDVIVEVLDRAEGKCEACLQDAPFLRAKDSKPYLEVHHKKPLSEGGFDVVENAIALCPNCHRKMHYGFKLT